MTNKCRLDVAQSMIAAMHRCDDEERHDRLSALKADLVGSGEVVSLVDVMAWPEYAEWNNRIKGDGSNGVK